MRRSPSTSPQPCTWTTSLRGWRWPCSSTTSRTRTPSVRALASLSISFLRRRYPTLAGFSCQERLSHLWHDAPSGAVDRQCRCSAMRLLGCITAAVVCCVALAEHQALTKCAFPAAVCNVCRDEVTGTFKTKLDQVPLSYPSATFSTVYSHALSLLELEYTPTGQRINMRYFVQDLICRQASDISDKTSQVFGLSFNSNGLGGVLTCGVTGMKAGLSHSPIEGVRHCLSSKP